MSTKKKYGVDSRAKAAAECYIALESAQSSISILIGVPDGSKVYHHQRIRRFRCRFVERLNELKEIM